jgi:hypothetical protein
MLVDRPSLCDMVPEASYETLDDVSLQVGDGARTEYRRYMSVISAPYFTASGRSADWGLYCFQCRHNIHQARIMHTEVGLVDHIARFGIDHYVDPYSLAG